MPAVDTVQPSANNNFGYIMDHQIAPNGGGTLVNQYTIIWDMYCHGGGTLPFFNCENTNNAPADGSLFLQKAPRWARGAAATTCRGCPLERLRVGIDWRLLSI